MILQNWWYTTLLNAKTAFCPPLKGKAKCDVLIVGAGMAGLHAALTLVEAGKKVIILEKNICGGSSTGKSAGFLTPDSELELHQLIRRFGPQTARMLWNAAEQGVDTIVSNAKQYKLDCDLQKQDSVFLGIGRSGHKQVIQEAKSRAEVSLPFKLHLETLLAINTGKGYTAGVQYDKTYGINPLLYAQEIKRILIKKGVRVYEGTQVEEIEGRTAKTHLGQVEANHIIVCIDKLEQSMGPVSSHVYHAQTFMSVSEPLAKEDIKEMFPTGKNMFWDSKLVYTYYRLTGDRRLLVGGGSALTTFSPMYVNSPRVIQNVITDLRKRLRTLEHVEFIQFWPGHIDTTKDLLPIIDNPTENVTFVAGCVGLPWATFSGTFAAKRVLDPSYGKEYCPYFKMGRKMLIPQLAQKILGKMTTFSLNNAYSKYLQKGY